MRYTYSFALALLAIQFTLAQKQQQKRSYGVRVSNEEARIIAKEAKIQYDLFQKSTKAQTKKVLRFNIQDEGYVTSIKNQQHCGSCVAFAWAATIESTIHKTTKRRVSASTEIDISEASLFGIHFKMMAQWSDCTFGMTLRESIQAIELMGVQPEDAFPYSPNPEDLRYTNRKKPSFLPFFFETVKLSSYEEIKQWIQTTGPVYASFSVPNDFDDVLIRNKGTYYNSEFADGSFWHAASCVGFDETYVSPDGKVRGAWICKNSWGNWGESWGTPGYFRIAYGQRYMMGDAYGVKVKRETCRRGKSSSQEMDLCDAPHIANELALTTNQVGWQANPNDPNNTWRKYYNMAFSVPNRGLNGFITCPKGIIDKQTDFYMTSLGLEAQYTVTTARSPVMVLEKLGCKASNVIPKSEEI